jgi:hypothetical protein
VLLVGLGAAAGVAAHASALKSRAVRAHALGQTADLVAPMRPAASEHRGLVPRAQGVVAGRALDARPSRGLAGRSLWPAPWALLGVALLCRLRRDEVRRWWRNARPPRAPPAMLVS